MVVYLNYIDHYVRKTYDKKINIDDCIRWFLNVCTIDMIKKLLIDYGKNVGYDNTRVKNTVHVHHAKRNVINMLSMLGLIDSIPCKTELGSISIGEILHSVPDRRIDADPNIRRTFTDDEVERMIQSASDNPVYSLMLTIFREVALRAGAICNLKYYDIIDQYNTPRHVCHVLEKGNKNREFVTSPNLKKKIVTYVAHIHDTLDNETINGNIYVFGREPSKPLSHSTLLSKLRTIASNANVMGVRVHPHAFRHTIVGKLMAEGNSADVVSKFMGHASTDTTIKYYWIQTIEELTKNLKNPFIDYKPSKQEIDDELFDEINRLQTKLDSTLKIIDIYNTKIIEAIANNLSVLELNQKINAEIPDIIKLTKILQSLHESTTIDNRSNHTVD